MQWSDTRVSHNKVQLKTAKRVSGAMAPRDCVTAENVIREGGKRRMEESVEARSVHCYTYKHSRARTRTHKWAKIVNSCNEAKLHIQVYWKKKKLHCQCQSEKLWYHRNTESFTQISKDQDSYMENISPGKVVKPVAAVTMRRPRLTL